MTDVIKSLRRYDFPEVLRPAFHQIEKCLMNKYEAAPGLELCDQIVSELVFQQPVSRKEVQRRRLTSIQELHITEAMIQYFSQKSNPVVQQQLFKVVFSSSDIMRLELLYKFVSMAIGVANSYVLNTTAVWMQTKGCGSEAVCTLCKKLVEDYFKLLPPGSASPIHKLPALSAQFTCNFITSLTYIYQPLGSKNAANIPDSLLEELSRWLADDPRLCLATLSSHQSPLLGSHRTNLWTSPTKSNTQTPTPGLVRWCIKAPLLQEMAMRDINNKYKSSAGVASSKTEQAQQGKELWSKLHLAVLETMLQLRYIPDASQLELLTLVDMNRAVKELVELFGKLKGEDQLTSMDNIQVAVDRLAQELQISLSTGAFRCSLADLRKILQSLPPSPLIQLLERQHLSTAPPAMHNAPM